MAPKRACFADLLTEETAGCRPGGKCQTGVLLDELDTETRAQVEAAMANPKIPASAVHRALNRLPGVEVGESSVSRHIRGGCKCRSTTS